MGIPSDTAKDLANSLSGSKEKQNLLPGQISEPEDELTRFNFHNYKSKIQSIRVKVESQALNTAFIMGHSTNGELGASYTLGIGGLGAVETESEEYDTESLVKTGLNEIAKFLTNASYVRPVYLGYGSGSTAVTSDDTALETEISRVALD